MCRSAKLVVLSLSILLFFSATNSFGQAEIKEKKPKSLRDVERKSARSRDSVLLALNKSDTSINTLLQHLQQYNTTFNQINNTLAEGLDTADKSQQLPVIFKRLARIKTLINTKKSSTLRYLFVMRDNLDHMQENLDGWQDDLDDMNTKLVQNQHDILRFSNDKTLNEVPNNDELRMAYFEEGAKVRTIWQHVDSVNRNALFKINLLQNKVSNAYSTILDESDLIDAKIKKFAMRSLDGEFNWLFAKDDVKYSKIDSALRGTVKLNTIQANYFFKNETGTHAISIAFLLVILTWILYCRYKTTRQIEHHEIISDHARIVYRRPVTSALLIVTTIVPYFYDHPPVFILECAFAITIILTLILVRNNFPLSLFNFLLKLFVVTIVYGLSNLLVQITGEDRYLILILSIVSIAIALAFYIRLKKEPQEHLRYTKFILKLFMILQALSAVLNITGRFSLAKIVGITAVFNLWLTVTLYLVIRIIVQTMFLQLHTKKAEKSFISLIDFNVIQKKFRNVLTTLASFLWIFFLLQNLNIDDWVHDYLTETLSQSRSIGGASFTFGGFVIFFIVIWLSSLVSRVISYFYDISAQHHNDLSVLRKKNRASTLLIRIGVFTIGFLLAVAASGFPIDKLTIIFSAFGVGIGFGLQNVTNNLVSGMILAFEKPIQIGDIIEVNGRQGTMKEIGIRSSKLETGDGAEVIIPNGDLISQNVVNWTLSNTNRQVELIIRTIYGSDIEKVKSLLQETLAKRDDIMDSPGASVFLLNVSEESVDFKVLFWAADISHYSELRSRVLSDIYAQFTKAGISLPPKKIKP